MLSNISSPALYMQAAFRAQNPHTFVRGDNTVLQKKNAYIFDFAPERTLTIFDAFANNLAPHPPVDPASAGRRTSGGCSTSSPSSAKTPRAG